MEYNELKNMAKAGYLGQIREPEGNPMKLVVSEKEKKIMLSFRAKPPLRVRKYMRALSFNWSRKHKNWHSYLNKGKLEGVKRIYRFVKTGL